jgi:diguanylate cyclase (GGDEF)-like protein/PAS domain S-box-containing protein
VDLLGLIGWPPADRAAEFGALLLIAVLISAFTRRPSLADDRGVMPLYFICDFSALLRFGPSAALLVATLGIVARALADPERTRPLRRLFASAVTVIVATAAAGATYVALASVTGAAWPWQAAPIAIAVAVYALVKTLGGEVLAPLLNKQTIDPSWPAAVVRNMPHYVIAAAAAAGVIEIVDRAAWDLLPIAAVPLYCAYHAYAADVHRVEEQYRRREVVASLTQGLSVLDTRGRVALWSDELERILECPRERAIGRPLASAVPALAQTQLPKAIQDAIANRTPQGSARLTLPSPTRPRALEIKLVAVAGGVTLLWQDVSDRIQAEQTLRRNEERFTLAAEGANDGLWEWDLRTQSFYASGRWKTLLGLAADATVARADDWFGRVHPEDMPALKAAIEAHLGGTTDHVEHHHRLLHEDGGYRRFHCRGVAARSAGQKPVRLAGSLSDAAEPVAAPAAQMRTVEFRDPLTGLCNRADFVERLGQRLADFKKQKAGDSFAALYLDLDRFKIVNDSLGHMVGDELLTVVSRRLESCLRQGDAIARLGGDEFAILLHAIGDGQQANAIAFRIQKALADPFAIAGREVFTSVSIGIAIGSPHYNNPEEIMRDADTAMYHAKSRGKARHELFDADMHARTQDRLGLENDLRRAIDANDFEIHYQPIVLLETRKCVGFESLIRWTRNGEPVSPATFIPMAEELGLIEPLGTWVLQQACNTFAEWKRQHAASGIDYITVNVSSRQLMQQNFMLLVEQAVAAARLKPCDLRLEITETALMDSPTSAAKLLSELRDFGAKIYLDDFGTGYSSLSHLARLPVDALKIDRSFVRTLAINDRPTIVESILALARTLQTSVVAEGIESEDQARELHRLGCTHAQGYLFSRPIPAAAAEKLLAANQPLGPAWADAPVYAGR